MSKTAFIDAIDNDPTYKAQVEGEARRMAKRKTGEQMTVEIIKGQLFWYGSELATLKLYKAFSQGRLLEVTQGYSENLGTYYVTKRSK